MIDHTQIAAAIDRHDRVAFHLSGGRDSVAALYAMRPYWGRMTVYHLDTGDQFPEVASVIARVQGNGVDLVRIQSSSPDFHRAVGLPSDLVPVDNEAFGRMVSGEKVAITSRYACCASVIMRPIHERMLADGITLIVRGQRRQDFASPPMLSGQSDGGIELLFPIEDWTDDQVDQFIQEGGLPVAPFYAAGMKTTPDCMGCTAWWGDGRLGYMKANHPARHAEVELRIAVISQEICRQFAALTDEV